MSVKDGLPLLLTRVELKPELTIREISGNASHQREQPSQFLRVFKLSNVRAMGAWHDENVNLGKWIDVPERNRMLIFSHKLGAEITSHYLAENTVQIFLRCNPIQLTMPHSKLKSQLSPLARQMKF